MLEKPEEFHRSLVAFLRKPEILADLPLSCSPAKFVVL